MAATRTSLSAAGVSASPLRGTSLGTVGHSFSEYLRSRCLIVALCLALGGWCFSGCSDPGTHTTEPLAASTAEKHARVPLGDLQIYSAASLSEVLPQILESTVTAQDPTARPRYNFNGSSTLVDEMTSGAPVDLLLTADERSMHTAVERGLVHAPQVFARNTLVLVLPRSNPAHIMHFQDLAAAGSKLVVCAPEVPCGHATEKLAQLNGVALHPVSEEQSVSDVLGKVLSGEADAGIVYKTDAAFHADNLEILQIPLADSVVNNYMMAVSTSAPHPEGATAVLEAVLSVPAQGILRQYGFASPHDEVPTD